MRTALFSTFLATIVIGYFSTAYCDDLLDSDNDGMPDSWETTYNLNPAIDDADIDNDTDGLTNAQEFFYSTNPLIADTDNDGLIDGDEVIHVNVLDQLPVNPTTEDPTTASMPNYRCSVWIANNTAYAKIMNSNGTQIGTNLLIAEDSLSESYLLDPQVTSNGTFFYITWMRSNHVSDTYDLLGRRLNPATRELRETQSIANGYGGLDLCKDHHYGVASNGSTFFISWIHLTYHSQYDDRSLVMSQPMGKLISSEGIPSDESVCFTAKYTWYFSIPQVVSNGSDYCVAYVMYSDPSDPWGDPYQQSIPEEFGIFLWLVNAQGEKAKRIKYPILDVFADAGVFTLQVVGDNYLFSILWNCFYDYSHVMFLSDKLLNPIPMNLLINSDYDCFWSITPYGNDKLLVLDRYDEDNTYYLLKSATASSPNSVDTDNDGLTDAQEALTYHTFPYCADSDNDGLTDAQEIQQYGTNPLNPDSDNDGIPDVYEVNRYNTNPLNPDSDNDGLTDGQELSRYYYDGFESDGSSTIPWDSSISWSISTSNPYAGTKSARFSPSAWFDIEYPVPTEMRFMFKTSFYTVSNALNPCPYFPSFVTCVPLEIYIDDVLCDQLASPSEWWEGSVMIPAGQHTVRFVRNLVPNQIPTLYNPGTNTTYIDEVTIAPNGTAYPTDPLNPDTDNDGIPDGWEIDNGINPIINDADADADNDGVSNLQEYLYNTDPLNQDTDNDGLSDKFEVDNNLNPKNNDTDNDGLPDGWEIDNGINPTLNDADADADNDGLTNAQEFAQNTDPTNTDTDNDGLLDGIEAFEMSDLIQLSSNAPIGESDIASNGETYFVVWNECDGTQYTTCGRLLDKNGNPCAPKIILNTSYSKVKVTTDGTNYCVVYKKDNDGMYAHIIDNTGTISGPAFQLVTTAVQPFSLASNGDTYFVLYQNGNVYGQIFDNDGTAISLDLEITAPCYVTSYGDTYLVLWGGDNVLNIKKYDSAGNLLLTESQSLDTYCYSMSAAYDGNNYFIVWDKFDYMFFNGIYGQFYGTANQSFAPSLLSDQIEAYSPVYPKVAGNGSTFLVTWYCAVSAIDEGAYGWIIDSNGQKRGDCITFATGINGVLTAVASDGKSFCVVCNIHAEEPDHGVYVRMITACGYTDPTNADTDNDGMPDGWEIDNKLDPTTNDASNDDDNDGLTNLDEYIHNTSANIADTDNDGIPDGWEISNNLNPLSDDDAAGDGDNDGLSNLQEYYNGTSIESSDTDNDGMPDGWEVENSIDPLLNDSADDYDHDGLPNLEEYNHGTSANNSDSDSDFIPDGWEVDNNFDPLSDDSSDDSDNDGLSNIAEFRHQTSPHICDTDNDGLLDGEEVLKFNKEFVLQISNVSIASALQVASNGAEYCVTCANDEYIVTIPYDSSSGYTYIDDDIQGQMFNSEGSAIGSKFQINSFTSATQSYQKIASSGYTYFITWQSYNQDGDEWGVYGQLIDNDGNKIGTELQLNTYTTGYQTCPYVASNGDTYFVAWSSWEQDGERIEAYGQLLDNDGNKIDSEFKINTNTVHDQSLQGIATDGNNYFVVWDDATCAGLWGQFFNSDGDKIGSALQLVQSFYMFGHITCNGDTYFIIWEDRDRTTHISTIYSQLFDLDGNKIGSPVEIMRTTWLLSDSCSVATDGNCYFVVWDDIVDRTSYIFGQVVDSYGKKLGPKLQLTTYVSAYPRIASNGESFFITWGTQNNMYGNIYRLGYHTDPLDPDTDNDGMPDGWEIDNGINPNINDADTDADNDGLTNAQEFFYSTNPLNQDTDNDGISDGDEINGGLNPLSSDTDNDGLADKFEIDNNLNPANSDMDNDGLLDGDELAYLTTIDCDMTQAGLPNTTFDGNRFIKASYSSSLGICLAFFDEKGNRQGDWQPVVDPQYADRVRAVSATESHICILFSKTVSGYTPMSPQIKLYAKLFNNDGTPVTDILYIETLSGDFPFYGERAKIVSNGTNFLIICMPILWFEGVILDPETGQLNSITNLPSSEGSFYEESHSIASNGSDYFFCWKELYSNDDNSFGTWQILGKLISSDGIASDQTVQISGPVCGNLGTPYVASVGGNYCVAYMDDSTIDNYDTRYGLYLSLIDASGNLLKQERNPLPNIDDIDLVSCNNMYVCSLNFSNSTPNEIFVFDKYLQPVSTGFFSFDSDIDYMSAAHDALFLTLNSTPYYYHIGYNSSPTDSDTDNDGLNDYQEVFTYNTFAFTSDTDSDELSDLEELQTYLTDPTNLDSDNDGISDGFEITKYGTNPLLSDTDNDGLSDSQELCRRYYDGFENGVSDTTMWDDPDPFAYTSDYEPYAGNSSAILAGTYAGGIVTKYLDFPKPTIVTFSYKGGNDPETNHPGGFVPIQVYINYDQTCLWCYSEDWKTASVLIPAGEYERVVFIGNWGGTEYYPDLDPDLYPDLVADPDTFVYLDEVIIAPDGTDYPTDPLDPDTDDDGIPDGWEIDNGINPTVNDADNDADNDGLTNAQEFEHNTDPFNSDTDNDGLLDVEEVPSLTLVDLEMSIPGLDDPQLLAFDGARFIQTSYVDNEGIKIAFFDNKGQLTIDWQLAIDAQYSDSVCAISALPSCICVAFRKNNSLYTQVFDNEGIPAGDILHVANTNSRVKVTASRTNFYISWMVEISGTQNSNLYGCVIDPSTSQLGATYSIVSDKRCYYSIGSNGSSFFVCWRESWQIETIPMAHNFGKIISLDGVPSDHTIIFNGPLAGFMSLPEISSDGINYCVVYPVIDPYIPDIYAAHMFLLDGSGKFLKHLKAPIPLQGAGDFFDIAYFNGMYGIVFYDMNSPQDQPAGISFFDRYLQPVTVDIDDLAGTPYIGFQGLTSSDNGLFIYLSETGDDYQPHFLSVGSNSSPIHADTDNDGLTDFQEFSIYHTNPSFTDTDNDGLTDYAELNEHLTNPTLTDSDNDGISDGFEINRYQTNPHSADSDNDGLSDSQELSCKYYDGFESGDFLALPWTVYTSQITDYTVYAGAYAVKIHGLSIDLDLPTTTEVSFYFKAGFDTGDPLGGAFLPLQVYIDEHSYDWSDTYDWFDSYDWHIGSVIVPAGQHTLTFAGYMTSDPTTSVYIDEVTIAPDGTAYPTDPLDPDTDNDGLTDGEEIIDLLTNPLDPDMDNDGMIDGDEVYAGMEPDNEHSLFRIKDIEFDSTASNMHISWFGSIASPDIGYNVLWSDPSSGQWNRIDPDNDAIQNTNGIRSWVDEGDNDATPPRPQPSGCDTRLYKVVVE